MKKLSSDIVETGVESQNGLMENSMIAFFLGKPNGSILQVNQAACDMFDYTAEEFKQLNQHDYIEFDDAELEKVISARREKGSIKAAFTAIRKNGERFPIEVFSVLFKNADGEERTSALVSDISERKKTKEAFVKARQQFEGLVNTVNGIVWEADAKTFAFSFVSKQAEVLLGYPIQQWLDVPTFWEDHIHPDDRHWAVAFCEQHVREKKSHKFEYRMIAADGRVVWLQDIVSVILENDEPAYITGLMIDITERKNTEQHLIDSERRYRSLFEQNVAGVYRTTISGRILACNLAFATMLGYGSSNELLDKEALDLYYSETERNQFIELLRKQKKIYNSEFVLKRKDNNPLFILENISLSADPNSGEEFIDGVMIDITERRNTAAALQKSYEDVIANESLLKSAEKLAHVGSWSADLVNGISKWSDEAFRIYGYEPGSIDPTFDFFLSRIHPDDLLMVKEKLEHALSSMDSQKLYFRIIDKHGMIKNIYAEHLIERNTEGAVIRMTGFNMDITEKIQLEEKLTREKQQKHQEITDAVITAQEQERRQLGEELHDNINQILATARLYIESAISDPNPRKDLLTESKDHIIHAVNEIRELSRSLMPPSLGVISLSEALKDLLESFKRVNDLHFITQWEALDETLISEKLKLTIFRIVQEQLNNVITHANATTVTLQLLNKEKGIQLFIKDDGIGFDTTQKKGGVGLQNITSRSELLGGNVALNTAPGKGCELTIDFRNPEIIKN